MTLISAALCVACGEAPGVAVERENVTAEVPQEIDILEPPPSIEVRWTDESLARKSRAELAFRVTNESDRELRLTVGLMWDRGFSRSESKIIGELVVAPKAQLIHRLDPREWPEIGGARYPGLLRVSVLERDGEAHVLPAFYTVPGDDRALMTGEELEASLAKISELHEKGTRLTRVVQWQERDTTALEGGAK